mmetsp:Transcript_76194/g.111605  ORF Transcript_76194/g.111605 Transcript_76194/m.111605 type:complete len:168 (+) Transcript_76194:12-515(+)
MLMHPCSKSRGVSRTNRRMSMGKTIAICVFVIVACLPFQAAARDGGRSGGRIGGGFKKSQPRETAATTTPAAVAGAPAAGTTEVHHHHHGGGGGGFGFGLGLAMPMPMFHPFGWGAPPPMMAAPVAVLPLAAPADAPLAAPAAAAQSGFGWNPFARSAPALAPPALA